MGYDAAPALMELYRAKILNVNTYSRMLAYHARLNTPLFGNVSYLPQEEFLRFLRQAELLTEINFNKIIDNIRYYNAINAILYMLWSNHENITVDVFNALMSQTSKADQLVTVLYRQHVGELRLLITEDILKVILKDITVFCETIALCWDYRVISQ